MRTVKKHIKLFFLFFVSSSVSAVDVDYSIGVEISKYDNLNLEQNPVQEEFSESIVGTIAVVENTADLITNLDASLQTINYRNDQAEDENLGNFRANVLWVISPRRYEWYISDTYTQTLLNSFDGNTQDNRQNTNAFSTGPNFIWRIDPRNYLNLDVRLEKISFENTQASIIDTDNDRVNLSASWEYLLRAASSLSFNYTAEMVDYDDDVANTRFDRNDVFLNLIYQRGMNAFEADIGVTHIDNRNEVDIDEVRYRLSVLNTRTRASTLQFVINRDISDTGRELLGLVPDSIIDPDLETGTADIFLDKTIRLIYNKVSDSGSFNVNAHKTDFDYRQQNQLDEIEKGILMTSIWNVRPTSVLTLSAQYNNIIFDNISREDDEYSYALLYTYNAQRHILVSLETTAEKRKSNDSLNDYDDFRTVISLTYSTQ